MPEPLPAAYIQHRSPARLRLKIFDCKGFAPYFENVEHVLAKCPGVSKVTVNPLTGSVLCLHSAEVDNVAGYAEQHGLFLLKKPGPRSTSIMHRQVATGFSDLNKRTRSVTGGFADLWDVAFMALLANGIYQIMRGNMAALPWSSAFWYAFGVYKSPKYED